VNLNIQLEHDWVSVAGSPGDDYPDSIRSLRGVSGVYLIWDHAEGGVTYVGRSKSNKLYGTMTRHFQVWGTSGYVIDRDSAAVDWLILEDISTICWIESYLINKFQPEGNTIVLITENLEF
jgi:hypothetical protein